MAKISTNAEINSIRLAEQASAPDTPASGYVQLYCKSDGVYFKGDNGTEIGPLATATSAPAFVGARYTSNAAQTITNGSAVEIVDFEDQVYDTDTLVTTGAAWKFTAPSNGYYHVDVYIQFGPTFGWTQGERAFFQLFKDGSVVCNLDRVDWMNSSSSSIYAALGGSVTVYLAANSYIDIRIAQSSGGDLNLSNSAESVWINIEKVG